MPEICPSSIWSRFGFEICWVDLGTCSLFLVAVLVILSLWFRQIPADDSEPLLNNEELSPNSTSAYEFQIHRFNLMGRSISIFVLFTSAIQVFLDVYYVFNLHLPTTVSRYYVTHLVSDLMEFFGWVVLTTLLFFISTKEVYHFMVRQNMFQTGIASNLSKIFTFALVIDLVRLYHWTVDIFTEDEMSKLDASWCFLLALKSVLIIILFFAAHQLRRTLEATGHTPSKPISNWTDTYRKVKRLIPFLWPNDRYLQFLVLCCFGLLGLGRAVNVLVPYSYKILVEDLSKAEGSEPGKYPFAWLPILAYTFFRFLQGGVGALSSLQYFLWIPVGQYTTREISVRMLEHLHSLSLQFHITSKTGELLRVMDRGTSSIGSLLSYLAFNILPVFVDIGLAVIYFVIAFDSTIAIIIFITMVLYIFFTIWITEWRTKFRREMNELDGISRGRAVDSLVNFETVKYFGNEEWEVKEFEDAILKYQVADWKSSSSLNFLNTAQNTVITAGLLCGLLITAQRVYEQKLTLGDFVSFVTYLLQLYQPLNWFGTYYRVIQQNFVDMEKMLDLFEENLAIKDDPNATEFKLKAGEIKFENVSFSYDGIVPVLKNLSFTVPAGKTYALVGSSGGGKSSILRLLFRFYESQEGTICIDGQDIKNVTQKSLRKHMGVVPQDTVLFNDTIKYNIQYGNVNASMDQIIQAAKDAQIHDRIISFPQGYETKVGERGLRLSGGEKQRIAIARTLLKNPAIILLDEATSALDNQTESLIQATMNTVFSDRTQLVVAHRLSTIVDADMILVIKEGGIVERGTHQQLLDKNGTYSHIWNREQEEKEEPANSK